MKRRTTTRPFERRNIEIVLRDLALDARVGGPGIRMVLAGLVWPRPTIAEKVSSLELSLADGRLPAAPDWPGRVLFKETVEGPFALELCVTETLTAAAMRRFLQTLAGAFLKLAGAEAGAAAGGDLLGGVVKLPLQTLGQYLLGLEDKPARIVARSVFVLGSGTGPAPGVWQTHAVDAVAAEDIDRTVRRRINGRWRMVRERVLDKGARSGSMAIALRYYD